jgi:hypothetical protein
VFNRTIAYRDKKLSVSLCVFSCATLHPGARRSENRVNAKGNPHFPDVDTVTIFYHGGVTSCFAQLSVQVDLDEPHIRTQIRRDMSYIASAAIRLVQTFSK